jgi:hypothetical protein
LLRIIDRIHQSQEKHPLDTSLPSLSQIHTLGNKSRLNAIAEWFSVNRRGTVATGR